MDRAGEGAQVLVDVVLPCLNEAAALPHVLGTLPQGYRGVVVDNGSSDGSPEIARGLGALVVSEPRRGYGAACHAGLTAATAPIVAFADADASIDLSELAALVALVVAAEADLALGRRLTSEPGSWPVHARVSNQVLAWYLRQRFHWQISEISPVRVARRTALLDLGLTDRRSGYPLETLLRAGRAGWTVREVTITYRPRMGRSKVTGTLRGTATAVADMASAILADVGQAGRGSKGWRRADLSRTSTRRTWPSS
ncbi:MAG: glycosyltransferase family 2 protein [Candidatus Nanopelagicales bacterium]